MIQQIKLKEILEYLLSILFGDCSEQSIVYQTVAILSIFLVGILIFLIMRYLLIPCVSRIYQSLYNTGRSQTLRDQRFLLWREERPDGSGKKKGLSILGILCFYVPLLVMHILFPVLLPGKGLIPTFCSRSIRVVLIWLMLGMIIKGINAYHAKITSKDDIKGANINSMLQMVKLCLVCFSVILSISVIAGMNIWLIMTGMGAFAAVLMLVFRDSIVGLVAGIQLVQNDMLKKGDWVTVKKCDIDGVVESINLTTVKIRNFDDTILTVPPSALVGDSFQNWKGMNESGVRGRRVKRVIPIDMESIRFLTKEEIDNIDVMQDLPDELLDKLMSHDHRHQTTNLTCFRAYLNNYLESEDVCNKGERSYHFVRLLNANEHGLPLEIYYYSNLTQKENWPDYENEQSKIVEFCLASLNIFGLRPLQCKFLS